MHEFPGTVNDLGNFMDPYERKLPARFVGDSADESYYPVDKFTQNLIKNWAIEGKTSPKNKVEAKTHHTRPTGHFYLTKNNGRLVAAEILCTHFKKCGADAETFLAENWDDTWKYWDVNNRGKVDVVGSGTLFRHLVKPLGELDLQ